MPYNIQAHLALPKIKASNRKQVFEILAKEIAAKTNQSEKALYDLLMEKERKSSSGIGDHVAIPHMKSKTLPERFITLATLDTPVDFDSLDKRPVDIVCLLLSPESDGPLHLRGLSRISRMLKSKALRQKLREAEDETVIQSLILDPEGWLLAA